MSRSHNHRNATYYDDNFGHYDADSDEDVAFYHQVQAESVYKICDGCGRKVKLRPEYFICYACHETMEREGDLNY
jgi:hypothetical protein